MAVHEACLYDRLAGNAVRCRLCAHGCTIAEGKFGLCGVRENRAGLLYTRTYGKPIARQLDPIEKKPLYHFLPGSLSYSVATAGCNFRCGYCQNWEISQVRCSESVAYPAADVSAAQVVKEALHVRARSISCTYTEPTIFLEYALDIASLAQEKGLDTVFVTNGFMSAEAVRMMQPVLAAANVDLKFFREESYQKMCGGRLEPVLDAIRLMKQLGVWIEITTLVVPGENDSDQELADIAAFIAGIDANIPWHLSRFHPCFQCTGYRITPEGTIRKAVEIGRRAGLRYLYAGNVAGWGSDTRCHYCHELLIARQGYVVGENHIAEGRCGWCGKEIPGVF